MPAAQDESASSALYQFGALLLENRRRIIGFAFAGALIALVSVFIYGPRYSATASFKPQESEGPDLSSLMGIAGQFGISVGGMGAETPPDLYAALATSSNILAPIARETFPKTFAPGESADSLAPLLRVRNTDPVRRHEKVIEKLQDRVSASVNRRTGMINLRVRTRWPAVSLGVAERILEELNTFNLEKRQSRAKAERVFAEERAVEAREQLKAAEDALLQFTLRNRDTDVSPTLRLELERREREVNLRQQLLVTLEQQFETARLREVQDTPVIMVYQPPAVLSVPDRRGRIKWTILGGILGLLVAAMVLPAQALVAESRRTPGDAAQRFSAAWDDTRRHLLGPFGRRAKA